jgi:hypothetical protein
MKITTKQLRRIIHEEAKRLNEMFTPIGGIGFGDIPRRPRSDYHNLTIVDQAYDDLVRESDVDECGMDDSGEGPTRSNADFTGDVADLAGEEAFGLGHNAGYEQASVDPAQAVVDQVVQSGVSIEDVVHKLIAQLSTRG